MQRQLGAVQMRLETLEKAERLSTQVKARLQGQESMLRRQTLAGDCGGNLGGFHTIPSVFSVKCEGNIRLPCL